MIRFHVHHVDLDVVKVVDDLTSFIEECDAYAAATAQSFLIAFNMPKFLKLSEEAQRHVVLHELVHAFYHTPELATEAVICKLLGIKKYIKTRYEIARKEGISGLAFWLLHLPFILLHSRIATIKEGKDTSELLNLTEEIWRESLEAWRQA